MVSELFLNLISEKLLDTNKVTFTRDPEVTLKGPFTTKKIVFPLKVVP